MRMWNWLFHMDRKIQWNRCVRGSKIFSRGRGSKRYYDIARGGGGVWCPFSVVLLCKFNSGWAGPAHVPLCWSLQEMYITYKLMIYICMTKWMIENKSWCTNFKTTYITEINILLVVKTPNVWMLGVPIILFSWRWRKKHALNGLPLAFL